VKLDVYSCRRGTRPKKIGGKYLISHGNLPHEPQNLVLPKTKELREVGIRHGEMGILERCSYQIT